MPRGGKRINAGRKREDQAIRRSAIDGLDAACLKRLLEYQRRTGIVSARAAMRAMIMACPVEPPVPARVDIFQAICRYQQLIAARGDARDVGRDLAGWVNFGFTRDETETLGDGIDCTESRDAALVKLKASMMRMFGWDLPAGEMA